MTDALSRNDTAALRVFEDGPLVQADIGSRCQVGCPAPRFSSIQNLTVNVPHQSGWPAMFFAAVTFASGCNSTASPCEHEFVAVQSAMGQPWKATLLISYGGDRMRSMDPQLLSDGFAVSATAPNEVVPPLLADFANYDTALKTTGKKPASTRLADGAFTSDNATQMYESPEHQRARGVVLTVEYSVDPADPIYTFTSSGGGTTACGTIRYTGTMTSADGTPLPASASVDEWRMRIADGSYRSLTLEGLHMVCFDVDPRDPTVYVIASWGASVAVSGERS
jgi:hypothetical protein